MNNLTFGCSLISIVGLTIILFASPVSAGRQPKWEAGVGGVGVLVPHYQGSNHYYKFTVPVPVAVFRTEFAELGQGTKFLLWESDSILVDFGFGGRIPVQSAGENDKKPQGADNPGSEIYQLTNYTRRGMDNLPLSFFWGLRFKWFFNEHLLLEVPLLNGLTVGGGFRHVGNIADPELSIDLFDRESDNSLSLSISWLHGDANYNNFYYKVDREDVIQGRPEYQADSGLVDISFGLAWRFQITDQFSVRGAYIGHQMDDSVVRGSPLVISKKSRSVAFSFTYFFFQSNESVRTWK
ncbi:MAG: MipA/OmpV family protein [SAR324 cluster bacterium]|nr:MipA/OmpV family protein [SAR324 cluster bacterium]